MAQGSRLFRTQGPLINLCLALLHQIKNPHQQLVLVFELRVYLFQKYFYEIPFYSFVSRINARHSTTQERNVSSARPWPSSGVQVSDVPPLPLAKGSHTLSQLETVYHPPSSDHISPIMTLNLIPRPQIPADNISRINVYSWNLFNECDAK
jgi:hypothetical protein